jgi:hypothetical protein
MKNIHIFKQPSGKPWLDTSLTNYVTDEVSYVLDPINSSYYKPHELFVWLCKNKAESALLNGLANLAPLFPFASYHDMVGTWYSPPPSGSGNAVVIVMGKHDGKVRMIGGNYFNEMPNSYKRNVSNDFWNSVDLIESEMEKTRYIALYVQQNMSSEDDEFARTVTQDANNARVMPVYLVLIGEEGEKNSFWAMPAIVNGRRTSDMSHEKMWEVK